MGNCKEAPGEALGGELAKQQGAVATKGKSKQNDKVCFVKYRAQKARPSKIKIDENMNLQNNESKWSG